MLLFSSPLRNPNHFPKLYGQIDNRNEIEKCVFVFFFIIILLCIEILSRYNFGDDVDDDAVCRVPYVSVDHALLKLLSWQFCIYHNFQDRCAFNACYNLNSFCFWIFGFRLTLLVTRHMHVMRSNRQWWWRRRQWLCVVMLCVMMMIKTNLIYTQNIWIRELQ